MADTKRVQIRLFDTPVLEFTLETDSLEPTVTSFSVLGDPALLPHGLDPSSREIERWLETRTSLQPPLRRQALRHHGHRARRPVPISIVACTCGRNEIGVGCV